jgi:hypothetical protein
LAGGAVANGAVIFDHIDDNDPSTEGFTNFGTAGTPVTSGGTDAWQINGAGTSSGFFYTDDGYSGSVNSVLTPAEEASMDLHGWTASWNVEVVNNSLTSTPRGVEGNLFVDNAGHVQRYSLRFGRSADGGGTNATGNAFQISLNGAAPFTFDGQGTGFHLIRLVTTGSTDTAKLYFDNTEVTTWSGVADAGGNYYAGDVNASPNSISNWNLVRFEINEPIPEPMSVSLTLLGAALLVARRRPSR